MNPELSIIIVNFNTSQLLKTCLDSIYACLKFTELINFTEIIVVDNASSDNSISILKSHYKDIILIENQANEGFSKANNQGMEKARGDYYLLLNSDTRVKNQAIGRLVSEIKKNKNTAAVGGKLLNNNGSIQPSAGYFPTLTKLILWMSLVDDLPKIKTLIKPYHVNDKAFYLKTHKPDWVSGACILLRKEAILKAGFLDEEIFMYAEEMEWCYRAKSHGFEIIYLAEAEIYHTKGASSLIGCESGILAEFQSIMYFYKKHFSGWKYPLVKLILIFGALLRLVVFGIIGKYPRRLPFYVKAIQMVRR